MKLTLTTTLADILAADTIELPEDLDLHSQIVSAIYKAKSPVDDENMLMDIETTLDDEDEIPVWIKSNPDKVPRLLDLWDSYVSDGVPYWDALDYAFDQLKNEKEASK